MKAAALTACCLLAAIPFARAQDSIDQLDMKAQKALEDSHYDEAIADFTRELKLSPNNPTILFNRGLAHEKNEETGAAIADYTAAIALAPGDPDAYEHRAKIRADAAMDVFDQNAPGDYDDKEDWDKAIADYCAAFEIRIKGEPDPKAWLEKKAAFGGEGYTYALTAAGWSEVIKLDPKDANAWFNRALVDPFVGDDGRELTDYSEAIRLDPKNAKALAKRAAIYSVNPATLDKALEDYTRLIAIAPDKNAYISRADVYTTLNQYDKALADCAQAIRLGGESGGYCQMETIHYLQHDWDKVFADYAKIIELNPVSDNYHDRAALYYERQDWDHVIADMDSAAKADLSEARDQVANEKENGDDTATLKGDGITSNTLLMRGDAFARKGLYDKALADFHHAAKADPDSWQAADAEAWLLATCPDAKFRNGAKALDLAMKTCLGAGWLDCGPVDTLAAAEAENGKWKEALDYENQAIKTAQEYEQDTRDDDSLAPDEKQDSIDDDERRIKEYIARLALYQNKQPCRDCKQLEWSTPE